MPKIVQFTHPGGEHSHDRYNSTHKSWNIKQHKRKFLLTYGKYQSDNALHSDHLDFWGEWEPPSEVEKLTERPTDYHPQWLHRPYLPQILPVSSGYQESYQNTDPCVFDGPFKYFVCKQFKPKIRAVTQLARLEKGSMILFGSTANQNTKNAFFQLDTVFIVSHFLEYDVATAHSFFDNRVGHHLDYSLKMAFPNPVGYSLKLRFYFGATFENQVNGMYSFSPAMIYRHQNNMGFPRIKLSHEKFITNNLNAAPKISTGSEKEIYDFWITIRNLLYYNGCVEGVEFSYVKKV